MKLMDRIKNYLKKAWEVPPPKPHYLTKEENSTGTKGNKTYENASFDVREVKVTGFGFGIIDTFATH